jgi:hypothetical protein
LGDCLTCAFPTKTKLKVHLQEDERLKESVQQTWNRLAKTRNRKNREYKLFNLFIIILVLMLFCFQPGKVICIDLLCAIESFAFVVFFACIRDPLVTVVVKGF